MQVKTINVLAMALVAMLLSIACTNSETSDEETAADNETTEPVYIDPVEAASEHYTLLSQEGTVRVVEMNLPAGDRDAEHSHHQETVYFISGGNVKIHVGEEATDAEIPDGHVMHHEPWTHSVENTGESAIHAIIFERLGSDSVDPVSGYIDPTVAASEHYTLLSEDAGVRVVHMNLPPGERDNEHSHHAETVYFLTGGKVNIHVGDEVVEAEIPDGHIMHHEPWTHSVENVGETTVEAIIFERVPGPG